jgi:hypothetical protein
MSMCSICDALSCENIRLFLSVIGQAEFETCIYRFRCEKRIVMIRQSEYMHDMLDLIASIIVQH